jgi:Hsp70 protein
LMYPFCPLTMVSSRCWLPQVTRTWQAKTLTTELLTTSSNFTRTSTDVTSNQRALGKLKREVEKAKCTLSSQQSTRIEIESFEDCDEFSETLTRAKFEELNMDLFSKTMKSVEQVLKDANVRRRLMKSSLLVVLPVFPRSSNSSRNFSAARSLPRVSTPTRPLRTMLLFKMVFYRAKLEVKILSLPSYSRYQDYWWYFHQTNSPQHLNS